MAESVSIVVKMQEDITSKLKTIASTSQGCSKEFESFQKRAVELGQKFSDLNKRYEDFSDRAAEAKAKTEALKLEMANMIKAARQSGEALDQVSYKNHQDEVKKLTDSYNGFNREASETKRQMEQIRNEVRDMRFEDISPADAPDGGLAAGRSKDGGSPVAADGALSAAYGSAKAVELLGGSLSEAVDVALTSAMGDRAGDFAGSVISGIASGLEAAQFLGESGELLGFSGLSGMTGAVGMGLVGLAAGLISAGAQAFGEYDSAFKDYYNEQYDAAQARTAESLTSGSSLAAGRETTKLSFTTLLGGAEQADAFLGGVLETANTTPFLYDDLVGISKTMLSFGTAVDDIIPTLTKVGDAGAAMGLGTGDIGTIATYLGRMQSSDKAALEYLNPLNERGFSVFQWLADDLGVSIAEVYDKISKSELSGNYVSDVILGQFEKLYGGMMNIQSKSTEGLDSTLQGLKENIDAAGGERYNDMRNVSKEADIAAYGGYLGDKLAELNAIGGEVKAYGENLRDQYQREALEAVLTRVIDRENTVFSEKDTEKLVELSAQYREAENAYNHGSKEAGQKMVNLKEEAEALAAAAYESSGWYQKMEELDNEQIAATRELIEGMAANTNALNKANERTVGMIGTQSFWSRLTQGSLEANGYAEGTLEPEAGASAAREMNEIREMGKTQEFLGEKAASGSFFDKWAASAFEANAYAEGGYAYGLSYVPYDEFPALLHQGERVLTAAEARTMDRDELPGGDSRPLRQDRGGVTVTVTGNEFIVRQDSDVDSIAETLARKLRSAMVRGGG